MSKKAENTMATRRGFLDLPEPKTEKVHIKALGKDVFFKKMSAADEDSYTWSMMKFVDEEDEKGNKTTRIERSMENTKCKFLVRVLVDETGNRLFENDEHELLGKKSPAIVKELYEEAMKVAGLDPVAVDGLEKNLSTEPIEDSPSD